VSRCRCPGPHDVEIVVCPPHCKRIDLPEVVAARELAELRAYKERTEAALRRLVTAAWFAHDPSGQVNELAELRAYRDSGEIEKLRAVVASARAYVDCPAQVRGEMFRTLCSVLATCTDPGVTIAGLREEVERLRAYRDRTEAALRELRQRLASIRAERDKLGIGWDSNGNVGGALAAAIDACEIGLWREPKETKQ
jgi:hypothetical protein